MSAGIAYSQALFGEQTPAVMVNIGVAGHQHFAVGDIYLADKCIDVDSQKRHYPPILFQPPCPTSLLQTAAKAQMDYGMDALYDMEASAFYETAARFTTSELIHSLKIISDNQLAPANNLQAPQVSAYIAAQLATIEALILSLQTLASPLAATEMPNYAELSQQYHFTATEQIQLKSLLSRWAVLTSDPVPELPALPNQRGKDFLRWLEQQINQLGLYL